MPVSMPSSPLSPVIVCPSCCQILQAPHLSPEQVTTCPRCARTIRRHKHHPLQKGLVLSLIGLLFYLPANLLPLMTFSVLGLERRSSIVQACVHLFARSQYFVGTIVALTTIVFPLLLLSTLLLVTLALARGRWNRWTPTLFRAYHRLGEWAMLDVFLAGVLITLIKTAAMASVSLNSGFFCLVGLVVTTAWARAAIDPQHFWATMEEQSPHSVKLPISPDPADSLLCHGCHKLLPVDYRESSGKQHCPRCGHSLHQRKQHSLLRTWILLIMAMVLTLPANLLPIMEVDTLGIPDRSTIIDGILFFFRDGSYTIGLVIFIASILVPAFKIVGMVIILLSIHFRWRGSLKHKAIMFRFIEFIGRWSMLDIFVITLLCALAQFSFLTSISAAPASFYFTGAVLSTMFAALSFDPRLLWDAAKAAETTSMKQ